MGLGVLSVGAQGVTTAQFTTGTEGWVVINWNAAGTGVVPTWYTNGGNPDGYVRCSDVQSDGFWQAPAKFHGDWSAAYGQILSYDAFTLYTGWKMNDVYIVGNGQTLSYWFPNNPPAQWQTFSVRLDASAGWQYGLNYDTVGVAATEAQIRSVLANVTDLRIREEYAYGTDDSGLDNVVVPVVVVPPAVPRFGQPALKPGQMELGLQNLLLTQTYAVEQTPTLSASNSWKQVLSFSATNSTQTVTLPMTNASMFYRLRSP